MFNLDMEVLFLVLGILVFLTNAIVEVIKMTFFIEGAQVLNKLALGVGVLLTVLAYFIYLGYTRSAFIWYYLVGSIIVGFIVSLIAMVGYDKVISMWMDSQRKGQ